MAFRRDARARAKKATRRALLQAGIDETIERGGIGPPTIEGICKRAGYTRGAFYFHFRDLDEFMTAVMDWVLTEVANAMVASTKVDAGVLMIVELYADILASGAWPYTAENRAAYLGVMDAVTRSERIRRRHAEIQTWTIEELEKRIRVSQKAGDVRADVPARHLASLLLLLVVGSFLWNGIGIELDLARLRTAILNLLSAKAPAARRERSSRSARDV